MGGDIDAARYWLKSFRPAIHDRAALVKLAMLQVSLAALTKKGGSGEPPILDLDENGLPVVVATRGDGLTDGKAMKPIMTMVLPYNGRHGPQPALEDDSSGRTLPLPSRVMVEVDENGEAMTLAADGKPVAPGAVRTLWRRIKAYNALAVDSGPARQDRPYYGNSAARQSLRRPSRSHRWTSSQNPRPLRKLEPLFTNITGRRWTAPPSRPRSPKSRGECRSDTGAELRQRIALGHPSASATLMCSGARSRAVRGYPDPAPPRRKPRARQRAGMVPPPQNGS